MIELLGAVGWGLLALGAVTHVWHHRRLRELLAMHLDNERNLAIALVSVEVALAIALPVGLIAQLSMLRWFAVAATALAIGFFAWIARLLATGSELPCACSFSSAPTTKWSLARAGCVGLVGLLAFVPDSSAAGDQFGALAVGWAVAAAIFVVPEALSWPAASKALMARVDAHGTA